MFRKRCNNWITKCKVLQEKVNIIFNLQGKSVPSFKKLPLIEYWNIKF